MELSHRSGVYDTANVSQLSQQPQEQQRRRSTSVLLGNSGVPAQSPPPAALAGRRSKVTIADQAHDGIPVSAGASSPSSAASVRSAADVRRRSSLFSSGAVFEHLEEVRALETSALSLRSDAGGGGPLSPLSSSAAGGTPAAAAAAASSTLAPLAVSPPSRCGFPEPAVTRFVPPPRVSVQTVPRSDSVSESSPTKSPYPVGEDKKKIASGGGPSGSPTMAAAVDAVHMFVPVSRNEGAYFVVPALSRMKSVFDRLWPAAEATDVDNLHDFLLRLGSATQQGSGMLAINDGRGGSAAPHSTSSASSSTAVVGAVTVATDRMPHVVDLRWLLPFLGFTSWAPLSRFASHHSAPQTVLMGSGGLSSLTFTQRGECIAAVVCRSSIVAGEPRRSSAAAADDSENHQLSSPAEVLEFVATLEREAPGAATSAHRVDSTSPSSWSPSLAQSIGDVLDRFVAGGASVVVLLPAFCSTAAAAQQSIAQDYHGGTTGHTKSSKVNNKKMQSAPATNAGSSMTSTTSPTAATKPLSCSVAPLSQLLPRMYNDGLEGHTWVSDGHAHVYSVGGMIGTQRMSAHDALWADPSVLSTSQNAFFFQRGCLSLRTHRTLRLFFTVPKATPSRSLTVPGLAYMSSVALNPPASCRDAGRRVLTFGGFLDCTEKPASAAFGAPAAGPASGNHNGSSSRSSSPQRGGSACHAEEGNVVRYGGTDCRLRAAAFNTTSDATVFIPTGFNRDLVLACEKKRSTASLSSWEAARLPRVVTPLFCTNSVWQLDLSSQRWEHVVAVGTIPSGRAHHSAAVCGSWMLIVGGITTDSVPCDDLFAFHVESRVWVQVCKSFLPLGISPLVVPTPEAVVFSEYPLWLGTSFSASSSSLWESSASTSQRQQEASSAVTEFYQLSMAQLLRATESRKRIEISALKFEAELQESGGGASAPTTDSPDRDHHHNNSSTTISGGGGRHLVLRTREELAEIVQRLTTPDTHSVKALEALRAKLQADADAASGAASRLRNIQRPKSELDSLTAKLDDKDRFQRRSQSSEAFIRERYESRTPPPIRLAPKDLEASVTRMSVGVTQQWDKKRLERLKDIKRKQADQRQPPSVLEARKQDASYVATSPSAAEVVARLASPTVEHSKQKRRDEEVQRCEAEHEAVRRSWHKRNNKYSPPSRPLNDTIQELYENPKGMEHKKALYERFVVMPESSRK